MITRAIAVLVVVVFGWSNAMAATVLQTWTTDQLWSPAPQGRMMAYLSIEGGCQGVCAFGPLIWTPVPATVEVSGPPLDSLLEAIHSGNPDLRLGYGLMDRGGSARQMPYQPLATGVTVSFAEASRGDLRGIEMTVTLLGEDQPRTRAAPAPVPWGPFNWLLVILGTAMSLYSVRASGGGR